MKDRFLFRSWMVILAVFLALGATLPARGAEFINGGFEEGTFNGWTLNGGLWDSGYTPTVIGTYTFSGDQGLSMIASNGFDPILSSIGINLPMVYGGTHAARVNGPVANYHFSTISQTASNWSNPHIFFAWFAVLQDPQHSHDEEPHFLIKLHDDTAGTNLYDIVIAADTTPTNFQTVATSSYGTVKYSGWQTVDLDVQAAGAVGHTLTLTCLASDCAQGGHWGYVYLDGFGAVVPIGGCSYASLTNQISAIEASDPAAQAKVKTLLRSVYWTEFFILRHNCRSAANMALVAKSATKIVRRANLIDDGKAQSITTCIDSLVAGCTGTTTDRKH